MNFKAASTFKPVDLVALQRKFVPKLVAAVTEGCAAVVEEAQAIVPVGATGQLHDSIHTASVELIGTVVQGTVVADAPHAGFVEFGTGLRGEGTYPYQLLQTGVPYTESWQYDFRDQDWQGHQAQPYMRPALDSARPAYIQALNKQGFK